MIPVRIFAGRDVAVLGLGLSGLASARALKAGGANPIVWDDKQAAREEARAEGFTVRDLAEADWSGFAALVLAPGIPAHSPRAALERQARARGGHRGDRRYRAVLPRAGARAMRPARSVVITGTNGKSTTTALTAHLFEAAGKRVALGGNIGKAVLDLEPFAPDLTYVIELSSFQIELAPGLKPDAAALLNITPDHLDRHGTLAELRPHQVDGFRASRP